MKVLDLVLKHKWYDMIDTGDKREEYRKIGWYWLKRLVDTEQGEFEFHNGEDGIEPNSFKAQNLVGKPYTHVRFHRGYTSTTMTFEFSGLSVGLGNPDWGAPKDEQVFIIKLGKRL